MGQYFTISGIRRNKQLKSVIATTLLKRQITKMAGVGIKELKVTKISEALAIKLARKGKLRHKSPNLITYRY